MQSGFTRSLWALPFLWKKFRLAELSSLRFHQVQKKVESTYRNWFYFRNAWQR
jgi:hypothetical protein